LKIIGWDATGIVKGSWRRCTLFKVGERSFGNAAISTRQELCTVSANCRWRIAGKKPSRLYLMAEAAALPLTHLLLGKCCLKVRSS